jgi:hypothetical protein
MSARLWYLNPTGEKPDARSADGISPKGTSMLERSESIETSGVEPQGAINSRPRYPNLPRTAFAPYRPSYGLFMPPKAKLEKVFAICYKERGCFRSR